MRSVLCKATKKLTVTDWKLKQKGHEIFPCALSSLADLLVQLLVFSMNASQGILSLPVTTLKLKITRNIPSWWRLHIHYGTFNVDLLLLNRNAKTNKRKHLKWILQGNAEKDSAAMLFLSAIQEPCWPQTFTSYKFQLSECVSAVWNHFRIASR